MKSIREKGSFTLIELIIVVLIIFTTYFLMFSNSSFDMSKQKEKIGLENLKSFLLNNYEFQKEISFVCIEDNFTCFVEVDDITNEDMKIENFFSEMPEVYEYNKNEIRVEFDEVKINDINHDVVFEFKINNDYKTNEFILDTQNFGVYVFNSIYNKPKKYDDLQMALEKFYLDEVEVRDAF